MAGGSPKHALIGGHLVREVGVAVIAAERESRNLKERRCDSYSSDLRIAAVGGTRYLYADAVVVWGAPLYDERLGSGAPFPHCLATAVVNPLVIFEVLSPTSESYDRGRKFGFYGALDALREYGLVDQERRRVEVSARDNPHDPWRVTVVTDAEAAVALPSLGVELPMAGIYRNWVPPQRE